MNIPSTFPFYIPPEMGKELCPHGQRRTPSRDHPSGAAPTKGKGRTSSKREKAAGWAPSFTRTVFSLKDLRTSPTPPLNQPLDMGKGFTGEGLRAKAQPQICQEANSRTCQASGKKSTTPVSSRSILAGSCTGILRIHILDIGV